MNKKLLFIFNPRSGKGKISNNLLEIIDIFVKGGYDVIAYPTQGPKDGAVKARAMWRDVDLIVCSGGDGTLDEVVTGLMEENAKVPLGYIPAGSTNDFANSLDIPKDMVEAAKNIMAGKTLSVDVGTFNDDTFIYVAAFGIFTDVSYRTRQDLKNIFGHLAYVMEGAKRVFDIKSYHLKVEANGNEYEGDYIYGMITNSHSVGGFRNLIAPGVEMDDGLFEVSLIRRPTNPLELNEIITSLVNGVDTTSMIDSFKTEALRITGENEVPWTLDGEFGGNHKEVSINNKKRALDILINS